MIAKNERYKPSKFKEYIESLDILNDEDRELMPKPRNYYPVWKHHIDAAKQGLLERQGILAKNPHGTFSISDKKFNDAYIKISDYIEVIKQSNLFPPELILYKKSPQKTYFLSSKFLNLIK